METKISNEVETGNLQQGAIMNITSIKERFSVRSIDSFQCNDWLLNKHYAKRIPSISYSFGLYNENILRGVITFGKPPMNLQRTGICGDEYAKYVYELNRLVISEGQDKNVLSFFVSKALNMLPKPMIIISYADKDFGHTGYIYQATNFKFVGETQVHKNDITANGMEGLHQSSITDKFRGKENRMEAIRQTLGDKIKYVKRNQKNRYIYFLGSKKKVKEFMQHLKYDILPYPKSENKRYDAGYNPTVQLSIF